MHHFPLCLREYMYQSPEKFGFREKFSRVNLIHNSKLKFAEKNLGLNNPILVYGTSYCLFI